MEQITLEDIRKALLMIHEDRKENHMYIFDEDCCFKTDMAGNPFELSLTQKGMKKIKEFEEAFANPQFKGELKTIFGIPIVVTDKIK